MTPPGYVDLGRRFVDLGARDLSAVTLRLLGESADRHSLSWDQLLASKCAVIVGEPGCGKTAECAAQASRLRQLGRHVFELTPARPLVSWSTRPALDAWRASVDDGVFFLDGVSGVGEPRHVLVDTLDRLATHLGDAWGRVRLVTSARLAEWQTEVDGALLDSYFPAQVKVARMVALSEDKVLLLAERLGAKEPARLRQELARADAWALIETPRDIAHLVQSWNRRGEFETLTQLVTAYTSSRLTDPDSARRRRSRLSADSSARAARETALCTLLMRNDRVEAGTRDLGAPDDGLAPAELLPWMEGDALAEFTDLPFFLVEPGARRVQPGVATEHLRARALSDALRRAGGQHPASVFFVRHVYGLRVVPPSLRGVAAWAAGSDADLRREVLAADPLVLLEGGDPQAIPTADRPEVLRCVLAELEKHPWRSWGADHASLARFACSDLEDVVRECLDTGTLESRSLALRLVWHGRMTGNAEDAMRLAEGDDVDELRGLALRAAAAAGDAATRKMVLDYVLHGKRSSSEHLLEVAEELYPDHMSTSELARGLLAWSTTTDLRADAFRWTWLIDRRYDAPRHEELAALLGPELVRMVNLLQGKRKNATPAMSRLGGVLHAVLARRLRDGLPGASVLDAWAPWFWALLRTHDAVNVDGYVPWRARDLLSAAELRRACLRWLVKNRRGVARKDPSDPFQVFREEPYDLWHGWDGDLNWRLEELASAAHPDERLLWFGMALRSARGDQFGLLTDIASRFPELADRLASLEAQRRAPPDPAFEEMKRLDEVRELERAERHRKNRADLEALVESIRRGTHDGALRFLVVQIEEAEAHSRWGRSNWHSLADPFGEEVAEAARSGFKAAWRRFTPKLPHERDKPNEVEWFVPVGLTGLNIGFADGFDPGVISDDEVALATNYALCEINDYPIWFVRLAEARPAEVMKTLETVLRAEYSGASASTDRSFLNNLGYRDVRVRALVTPGLLRILEDTQATDHTALDRALAAVQPSPDDRARLTGLARERAALDGDEAAAAWWRCLATLDAEAAASKMLAASRSATPDVLLASVAAVDWSQSSLSAEMLAKLVRLTYEVVAPTADIHRPEGVGFSPGVRDEAERKRSRLVDHLASVPGEATYQALNRLADDPAVAEHRDGFLRLAFERARSDSEWPAMGVGEARAFVEGCWPPTWSTRRLEVEQKTSDHPPQLADTPTPVWLTQAPLADDSVPVDSAVSEPDTPLLAARRAKLFISYSQKDASYRDELEACLSGMRRQDLIESWCDSKLVAGERWEARIMEELNSADIILLLVSWDFLSSDFCCEKEVPVAMKREAEGTAVVIPIAVRDCDWTGTPFAHLTGSPLPSNPISRWPDRDQAWTLVATKIRKALAAKG